MSVFDNFTKKVTETAKAAAKKSSELVEVTKLNISVGAEEDKIEKVYSDIGKMAYAAFLKGELTNDAYMVNFEKIKSYEENIYKMKQKILELKSTKICAGCGEELDLSTAFCSKCGTKQEIQKPAQEEPAAEEPQEPKD
jgi:rRNA maturation endonuclease Nob1